MSSAERPGAWVATAPSGDAGAAAVLVLVSTAYMAGTAR